MNEEQEKIIDEQFKTLPKNTQRAIALAPWRFNITEIGKSYNLTPEQIEKLERETMFILYGFESAGDYIQNVIQEVDISQEIAEKIAQSTTEKIFEPILNKKEEFDKSDTSEETNKKEENYMIPNTSQDSPDPRDEVVERLEQAANLPEIAPENHPQIVPGETAHETVEETQTEKPEEPTTIPPKTEERSNQSINRYPSGQDPYREPLE